MHTIVIDLGFGDSGKGTIVEALARSNPDTVAVVRFSGGAQAQHNVVTDDGRHHTFSQFGSATLLPNIRTHLSQFMMVNPGNLLREERHLREIGVSDAFERLSIHPDALIITPWHQRMNMLRSGALGELDHGTTGQGIGETMKDSLHQPPEQVLFAGDLLDRTVLHQKVERIRKRKLEEATALGLPTTALTPAILKIAFSKECLALVMQVAITDDLAKLAGRGDLIFEGAQGVLIDQDYGFHPHTTWSSTTGRNTVQLLFDAGVPRSENYQTQTIGVLRTYQTRHGAGPFVTEHELLFDEPHNDNTGWAGKFRTGHLDLVALKYALSVSPVDALAITHMDRVGARVCESYRYTGTMTDLDPYFYFDETGMVTGIKKPPHIDSHAHMEAITNRLFDMKPNLSTVEETRFVEFVEHKLGRPVMIESHSPTFAGKTMRQPVTALTMG